MAVRVDWLTKVIHIDKSDLTATADSAVFDLDLDDFRSTLKTIESGEGLPFPDMHKHNSDLVLSGLSLAPVVEFINGYTVTFEDGQYIVNLTGANNNLMDVANHNQVSIRSNNSAGLISSRTSQDALLFDKVEEMHRLQGLEAGKPMTVDDEINKRYVGSLDNPDINQSVVTVGNKTTVTRVDDNG